MCWSSIAVCMLAVVVTVSAQCNSPTFDALLNKHIRGGTLDSSALTLAACQDNCVADNSCFAVDVVTSNPFRCYKLYDPTLSLETENDVTHYRMSQTCVTSSTRCTYNGYSSYKFSSYLTQGSCQSYDICADRCANNGSSCFGFSYNSQQNSCQLAGYEHFANNNLQKDSTWKTLKKVSCQTVCVPFYAKKVDKSSAGGSLQVNINSELDCKNACAGNNNCTGFDLDKTGATPTCWIHTSISNLNADRDSPGVTQYVMIERCPKVTCQPSYQVNENTHSPKGVLDSTLTSESSCKQACAENYYCKGFDLVNQANQLYECWLHTNATNFDQKLTSNGVTQYTLSDRCPQGTTVTDGCVITYATSISISSPYGVRSSTATSETMCKAECNADSTCLAFDLDQTGTVPSCWLHKSASNLNQKRNTPGISQYVKINTCSTGTTTPILTTTESGCQIRWDSQNDTSSVGASLQSGITDNKICLDGCISNPSCVAVDFNWQSNPGQCWYHFDSNKILTKRSDKGIIQYVLNRCYKSGCKINWQTFRATKSHGAVLKSSITTLSDCQKQCENQVSCVGVDFNFKTTPQQCWFHDDVNKILNKVPDVDVDQYVLDRCYTDGCQIRWNNLTSTGSVGAMLQSGLTSLGDCLNGCILDTSCVAVDFNFKVIPNQCWFHTEMNKVQVSRRDVETNQYILDRCYKSPCPKFTQYSNKHTFGGLQQNQAKSIDQCEQICLASNDCQGYDFDSLISGCFIFNMATREENLVTQSGTNHYELVCRSGETVPPSTLLTTTKAAGSTTQWLATTSRKY